MATWIRCTTVDGNEIRVNADHVVMVRQYQKDRGGTGSEIIFAGGAPSNVVVKEDQEHLTGRLMPSHWGSKSGVGRRGFVDRRRLLAPMRFRNAPRC
jgi:hypothetical protein